MKLPFGIKIILGILFFNLNTCSEGRSLDVNKLIFNGAINEAAYKKISHFLKGGGKTIIINSEGGDVKFGHKIGMVMADKDITLIVDKYCLSSCANYLFLSAKSKNLQENAILGFHGGVGINTIQTKKITKSSLLSLSSLIKNERLFFEKIKVDYELINVSVPLTRSENFFIDVTITGKIKIQQTFNGDQEDLATKMISDALNSDSKAKFNMTLRNEIENTAFFPSKETLIKYGVKGVGSYPYPKNQGELSEIAKNADVDFKVVGDFKMEEPVKE